VKRTRPLAGGLIGLLLLGASVMPTAAAGPKEPKLEREPLCESNRALCVDPYTSFGSYVGHDEPSVLFKSPVAGSGNDITYQVTLPTNPTAQPQNDGSGATWDFQLRPTFWFGLTLCDTESAPEFTKTCKPDSDSNDLTGLDWSKPDYIGKHPGNAFMELQFYGPGYVPQFEGFGCTATQYCAAMTIDSLTLDQNKNQANNADCDNYILGGIEPINWAYITRNGVSQAPANPLFTGTFTNPNFAAVNPDPTKDLMMNPGDRVTIHMHDTTAGLRIDLNDTTTGQTGFMTASTANGFGHILFQPHAKTCSMEPYAFHPEYSTANPRGNTWSAHTYNVAFSDEIGHFEDCNGPNSIPATPFGLDPQGNPIACPAGNVEGRGANQSPTDGDDNFCFPGSEAVLVHINGCTDTNAGFDGLTYQPVWPDGNTTLHPQPFLFSSPRTGRNFNVNYTQTAFEADLPRIETNTCDRTTGTGCTLIPTTDKGQPAAFYPFFSTLHGNGNGHGCLWAFGNDLPGGNDLGRNAQYGTLLSSPYLIFGGGGTAHNLINNFRNIVSNPCRA
jgi:hypothetical protein